MIKKISVFLCVFLLVATSAFAHVMNKNNVFSDLSLTEAADEVVFLSALGLVSYLDDSFEFKPTEKLTAKDLAAWVASYNGLEGATSEALSQAALDAELISTIEGDATYQLVNEVYFHGKLTLEQANVTMTREEFAIFVGNHLQTDLGGHTLIDMSGYKVGPTGIIEHVERVQKKTESGSSAYVYMLTIDGIVYEVGMHPRALSDSPDPSVWIGQQVAQSFIGLNGGTDIVGKQLNHDEHMNHETVAEEVATMADAVVAKTAIQFLVVGEEPFIAQQEETTVEEVPVAKAAVEEALTNVETVTEEQVSSSNGLWLIIAILVVVIGAGFIRKKSKKA